MINSIALQSLRNSEFLQFATDTLAIVNLNNPQALHVQEQYDALLAAKNVVEALFNKDQSNPMTEELIVLDTQRDSLFNGISALVLGHTYHFDETIKKHAATLNANISSYGAGIARENYQSETAIIKNILNDWNTKADLTAAIAALQLVPWKDQLENANTSFNTKYLTRTQQLGAQPTDSMKEKRAVATNAYYELRNYINSYFTINKGVAPFGKTTNEINALIEQYNKLVSGRGKAEEIPLSPQPVS